MSPHGEHLVPAGDGTFVVVLEDGCLECAQAAIDRALPATGAADEVTQAFATLRRHLPASLRPHTAALEAAWFNGGPLPVDWPTRFRTAAGAASDRGEQGFAGYLEACADSCQVYPAHVVEAIGRALLREAS